MGQATFAMTIRTTITDSNGYLLAEWFSVNDHRHDEATAIIIGTLAELKVTCAWCKRWLRGPEDAPPEKVTHGCCPKCKEEQLRLFEQGR